MEIHARGIQGLCNSPGRKLDLCRVRVEPSFRVRYRKGQDLLNLRTVPRNERLPASPSICGLQSRSPSGIRCVTQPLFAVGPQGHGQRCPSISSEWNQPAGICSFTLQMHQAKLHNSF